MPRTPASILVTLAGSTLVVAALAVVVALAGLFAGIGPFAPVVAVAPSPSPSSGVAAATATPAPTRSPAATASASPSPSPSAPPSPTPGPTPVPTPTPEPTPVAAIDLPATGPVEVNLYGRRDFVSQVEKDMCVSGAMQTMLNITNTIDDRSARTQYRIAALALRLSKHPDGGTEPEGWAAGLQRMGAGKYRVDVAPYRSTAILRAARRIVETGRPVGLLVWRGAHSWVMHGFRATGNPLTNPDARITHVWISDPWYPRVSSIWGASRPPNSLVPVGKLREDYLPWRRPTGRYPGKDGRFVMVMPVASG